MMRKYFAITLMLFFCMNIFGQVREFHSIPTERSNQLDKMGIDDSTMLNSYESDFLNEVFKDSLKVFDFIEKRIGFLKGGSGSCKSDYFKMHKTHISDKNSLCDNGHLYIFNKAEKEASGGYDAAIVYWSKFAIPKDKLLKRLKSISSRLMINSK